MKNNYNYEAAKLLIEEDDNVNVTNANPIKDLFQICTKLVLILFSVYLFIFVLSGIIIKNLSTENQIALEDFLSARSFEQNVLDIDSDTAKKIRDKIVLVDNNFPKTSKLDIKIINDSTLNALCYPNGNIYITSELYKKLNDEEMLAFVVAHEMAHYKNRDHLMNLRKSIAGTIVVALMSVASPNSKSNTQIVESVIALSDLKYSRRVESKADDYAANILIQLYGNINGGIRTLEILGKDGMPYVEILATHPDIKKRIKKLQTLKY